MSSEPTPSDLERTEVSLDDGHTGRVYTHETLPDAMPSVTTVLDEKENPVKDDSLAGWRNYFDGSNEERSPLWRDQMHFKAFRGTLCHYAFATQHGEMDWTDEEANAEEKLKNWWAWKPSSYEYGDADDGDLPTDAFEEPSVPDDVYEDGKHYWQERRHGASHSEAINRVDASLSTRQYLAQRDNCYDGDRAYELVMDHVAWVNNVTNEDLFDQLPIESVVDVETYVLDQTWGFAGQFDLCGEDADGNVWIGDLKTSSGIDRITYKLQLAAYAYALDDDVAGVFLLRLDPDDEVIELRTNDDWDRSLQGLINEFLALSERCHIKRLSEFNAN